MLEDFKKKFTAEIQSSIDQLVHAQDFDIFQSPLKTSQQYKFEVKNELYQLFSYEKIVPTLLNSVDLINQHLDEKYESLIAEKVRHELGNAFDHFKNIRTRYSHYAEDQWINQLDPNMKPWDLYGISAQTLLIIYEVALKCYQQNERSAAKDLLTLLLNFAPTVSSYWNALGYLYQMDDDLETAINHYLISMQVDPDNFETYFFISRCYMQMKEYSLAYEQVSKLKKNLSLSKDTQQWGPHVEKLIQDLNQQRN